MKEQIQKIRNLISKEENWCQYDYAQDEHGNAIGPQQPNACKWCVKGAMSAICSDDYHNIYDYLKNLLPVSNTCRIASFNDSHSHHEVIQFLDKAIEKCG